MHLAPRCDVHSMGGSKSIRDLLLSGKGTRQATAPGSSQRRQSAPQVERSVRWNLHRERRLPSRERSGRGRGRVCRRCRFRKSVYCQPRSTKTLPYRRQAQSRQRIDNLRNGRRRIHRPSSAPLGRSSPIRRQVDKVAAPEAWSRSGLRGRRLRVCIAMPDRFKSTGGTTLSNRCSSDAYRKSPGLHFCEWRNANPDSIHETVAHERHSCRPHLTKRERYGQPH
jgi:hypothetical protein